jgi:hypothetical protein
MIETAPIAVMSGLTLRKRRAPEIPLHGAPTDANLVCNRVQGPAPPMICPHLLVVGPPSGAPLAGQSCRRGGRLLRCGRHGGLLWGCGRIDRIVHRRGRGGALGIDTRQLGSLCGEYVGQHGGQILQQMEAVSHLARRRSPQACPLRVRLCTIPHEDLNPGMRLKPLCHGGGLPIGKQGKGPPPCEVQQAGAIGMTLPPRTIVHAEDLWGDNGGTQGVRRITRSRVLRLPASPNCRLSRTPAAPPRARPMARRCAVSRNVRIRAVDLRIHQTGGCIPSESRDYRDRQDGSRDRISFVHPEGQNN